MNENRTAVLDTLRKVLPEEAGIAIVHSSIGQLGPPEDFVHWDILWAIEVLSREGWTFVFPSFTFSFCNTGSINLDAPNSETGILADWVATLSGAQRTCDPIYSCVVVGPQREVLVEKKSDHPFAEGSLFHYLDAADATIVMLGADLDSCTLFHLLEYERELPYRQPKRFDGIVRWVNTDRPISSWLRVRDERVGAVNDFAPLVDKIAEDDETESQKLWRGVVCSFQARTLRVLGSSILDKDPWAFVSDPVATAQRAAQIQLSSLAPPFRVALLGNANMEILKSQLLEQLPVELLGRGFKAFTLPFGQLAQQQVGWSPNLRTFGPDLAIFCSSVEDLLGTIDTALDDPESALDAAEEYGRLIVSYAANFSGRILVQSFGPARLTGADRSHKYRELLDGCNSRLLNQINDLTEIVWVDTAVEAATSSFPVFDPRLWQLAKIPFSDGFSRHLARIWTSAIAEAAGKSIRAIVLDLDNTLWGGVVGEDGLEGLKIGGDFPGSAFSYFQKALLRLKNRGLILALSSKNDLEIVEAVFRDHPEMVLSLNDFSEQQINWDPKSANLVRVADALNLGLDSLLFVDDNPAERHEVATRLPGVHVLDLPEDPARFVEALLSYPYLASWFDNHEGSDRTASYNVLKQLKQIEGDSEQSRSDFLKKLDMTVYFEELARGNLDRAAQLCQKTNQFNTTTKRYSSSNLLEMASTGADVVVIGLQDRYLARENIGLLILKPSDESNTSGEIDLFLLSCRVLGRGLEDLIIEWSLARAKMRKWVSLKGRIIETPRNSPVRSLFEQNRFVSVQGGEWARVPESTMPREEYSVSDGFGPWANLKNM